MTSSLGARRARGCRLLLLAGLIVFGAGCGGGPDETAAPEPSAAPAGVAQEASVRFEAVPGTGVDLRIVNGDPAAPYIIDAMGTGACLLDHDEDGHLDLFVVNGSTLELLREGRGASSRLYRNRGDWTFEDVTERAGVPGRGWGQGCAVGDVDADGDPDLYLTALGENLLYLNQGDGSFREAPPDFGAADPRWSASAAFGDLDGDGVLDLYVTNYVVVDLDDLPEPHAGRRSYQKLIEVFAGPQGLVPAPDGLYRGLGDGRFEDVSRSWGAHEPDPRYGLGVLLLDADGDGRDDVYVANDSQPNYLFLNQGGGRLTERGLVSGAALSEDGRSQAGMGVAAGDQDGDGREDLFVTNFADDGNTLYRNLGRGFFGDRTAETGLARASHAQLGWGAHFLDADLDGRLDLFLVNGHVYPQVAGVAAIGHAQRNQLFLQQPDGRYREQSAEEAGSGLALLGSSRGLACGDLDNDGDLDLVVVNVDGGVDLLRNDSPGDGGRLGFSLRDARGVVPEGATVFVEDEQGHRQLRRLRRGASYLSSHDPRVHFGTGAARRVGVSVRWPDGSEEDFGSIETGRHWSLEQGTGRAEPLELPRREAAAPTLVARALPKSEEPSAAASAPPAPELGELEPDEHLRYAREALASGRFGLAIRHAQAAAAARPEDAGAHALLGRAAFVAGRRELAREHLRIAAELQPGDADAQLRLAELLVNERDLDAAIAALQRALSLRPGDGAALYLLGVAQHQAGRNEEAAAALARAAPLVPAPAKVHERRGLALFDLGRFDEAVPALQAALAEDPHLLAARYCLERIRAHREGEGTATEARELERLSQLASDITHQRAIVEAAPRDDRQRYSLAVLLRRAGRHAEARAELATVLNRRPQFVDALLAHAECSIQLGDHGLAQRVLDRVEQLQPAGGRAALGRAHLELARDRPARALAQLRLSESREPDSVVLQEDLARLLLDGAEGVPANPPEALDHARRARALGSEDLMLFARCLARAGAAVELAALVEERGGQVDGATRRSLTMLLEEAGESGSD